MLQLTCVCVCVCYISPEKGPVIENRPITNAATTDSAMKTPAWLSIMAMPAVTLLVVVQGAVSLQLTKGSRSGSQPCLDLLSSWLVHASGQHPPGPTQTGAQGRSQRHVAEPPRALGQRLFCAGCSWVMHSLFLANAQHAAKPGSACSQAHAESCVACSRVLHSHHTCACRMQLGIAQLIPSQCTACMQCAATSMGHICACSVQLQCMGHMGHICGRRLGLVQPETA